MKVLMAYVFWRTVDRSEEGDSDLLAIEDARPGYWAGRTQ